jgi:eukaryotic-like serine/threonine-protein kinase
LSESGASAADARLGQVLGSKYRIVRLIGQGGMGTVYEARHELIGRRFAIKFLRAELTLHEDIMARFRREAQAAGALENENIAAVTDFGEANDGAPYIVMEFLQGEDLSRLLTRVGPLPVPRAVYGVIQACRGLEAAHANGIVHRDLKPENLYVIKRGDGTDLIKVLDFGIAKLQRIGDSGSSTRTGMTMGTPFYMPPEQARGQKDLDHRADIYALGVILYEILSGQKPFNGDGYNAIMFQIMMRTPARLETVRANLPTGLADVVHKAMAADATHRFTSVSELIGALAPFAGRSITPVETGERLAARTLPEGASATVVTPAAVDAQRLSPTQTAAIGTAPASEIVIPGMPQPVKRGVVVGLVVAVLVAGGVALALLRAGTASETQEGAEQKAAGAGSVAASLPAGEPSAVSESRTLRRPSDPPSVGSAEMPTAHSGGTAPSPASSAGKNVSPTQGLYKPARPTGSKPASPKVIGAQPAPNSQADLYKP